MRVSNSFQDHVIFFLTHLNPFHCNQRMKEISIINQEAYKYDKVILLGKFFKILKYLLNQIKGDLNSLSPFDMNAYIENNIYSILSSNSALKDKFLVNDKLDFQVMKSLYYELEGIIIFLFYLFIYFYFFLICLLLLFYFYYFIFIFIFYFYFFLFYFYFYCNNII